MENDSGSRALGSKWIADQDTSQFMVSGQGHLQVARVVKMKHLRDVNDANDSRS